MPPRARVAEASRKQFTALGYSRKASASLLKKEALS